MHVKRRSAERSEAAAFRVIGRGGNPARYLKNKGIETEHVPKVTEGRPHVVDKIVDGDVDPRDDSGKEVIRRLVDASRRLGSDVPLV